MRNENLLYFDDTEDVKLELMINLEFLSLSQNKITNLSGVGKIASLLELNLNYNCISDLSPLINLTSLQKL